MVLHNKKPQYFNSFHKEAFILYSQICKMAKTFLLQALGAFRCVQYFCQSEMQWNEY